VQRQLSIDRILVFHDFPELFLAKDALGLDYICMLIINTTTEYEYLCVAISKNKLYKFLNGKIDLRQIYLDPEIKEWYSSKDTSEPIFFIQNLEISEAIDEFLPTEGYFYSDDLGDDIIRKEVVENNNVIIHISLSDQNDDQSIPIDNLGDFSKLYQAVVENAYKKVILNSTLEDKKSYIIPQNYSLRAFASSPGSFVLHLKSKADKDLFGNSIIEEGLKKIDEIISDVSDSNQLIENLRSIKGHTISNYKKLIEKVISLNITFKYKWLSPNSTEIQRRTITKEYAEKVKEILVLKDELTQEIKEFTGYVKQADVERGSWRITNEDDNKDYSGESKGHLLEGITLETTKYKFICEEVIETLKVTEQEKIKYLLKEVSKVE